MEVNDLYNEIREILKLDYDSDERHMRIGTLLSRLANIGVDVVVNSKDPQFSVATYFAGFSAIALMIGATTSDHYNSNKMAFANAVVGMCTAAIAKQEAQDGTEEEE